MFASGHTRAERQDLANQGFLKVKGKVLDIIDKPMGFACFVYNFVHPDEKFKMQAVREEGEILARENFDMELGNFGLAPGSA